MPIRVNGGVFTDQVLTGSLQHFRVVGANFTGAVGPTGQPIPDSAAEIIFTRIAGKATVVIMNPLTDPLGMSFALETNRADWTQEELQIMINSLGTIGVDQVDVSNVIVEQVPYDLIDNGGGTGGATTFIQLTDTPSSYTGANNKYVAVNAGATGLTFITPPSPGSTTFTGLTDTPANYSGAANKYVTVNPSATGLQYTILPAIPTNNSFTLTGLSDTADSSVSNAYLQWNSAGTQVNYVTTIPSSSITGLATVATSGSYTDLTNKPTIPTNNNFTLTGLSDTANTAVPNAYLQWNSTGTQVNYTTTISASSITGLATVATTGSYTDLLNQPDLSIYAETADLATVATTGSYTDLLNQPTIPNNDDFSFVGLDDTPNSYAGQSGKYVVVNTAADGLEFVTGQPPAVNNQVFYNNNGVITQTLSTIYSTLLFETSVETSADVLYATGVSTIQTAGTYTISYQISSNGTTAARTSTECKMQIDGVDVPGSYAYTYNRNSTDGRSSLSATVRVQLTAGQEVVILGRGTVDPVVTLSNACRLLITRDI